MAGLVPSSSSVTWWKAAPVVLLLCGPLQPPSLQTVQVARARGSVEVGQLALKKAERWWRLLVATAASSVSKAKLVKVKSQARGSSDGPDHADAHDQITIDGCPRSRRTRSAWSLTASGVSAKCLFSFITITPTRS